MGRTEMAVLGGGLAGLGKGLVDQEKVRRDESNELRDRALMMIRDKNNRGLIYTTTTDADGNLIGITRGGDTKNLNIKGMPPGRTADDSRLIRDMEKKNTTTDSGDIDHTDYGAVGKDLLAVGRQDLAKIYEGMGSGPVDKSSDAWLSAKKSADNWVSEQAGFFSGDTADFADYGGNREQAKSEKTLEFYRMGQGQKQVQGPAASSINTTVDGDYSSPEDVGLAFTSGKISRTQAEKILREKFGQL